MCHCEMCYSEQKGENTMGATELEFRSKTLYIRMMGRLDSLTIWNVMKRIEMMVEEFEIKEIVVDIKEVIEYDRKIFYYFMKNNKKYSKLVTFLK